MLFVCSMIAVLTEVRWNLNVVLIYNYLHILVRDSIATIEQHDHEQLGEGKVDVSLHVSVIIHHEREDLKAETWNHCFLLSLPVSFYHS